MANQPTFDDVMLAILALDAYSRGDGTEKALTEIGGAELSRTVGGAVRSLIDSADLEGAETAGFGASAYSWSGKTVIAYRGTDFGTKDPTHTVKDVAFG